MNKEPLVSVIMNCYNGGKYLGEAIHSVYSQTYKNWNFFWIMHQLIIVNILQSHKEVISLLSAAKFYINTSKVENSWNAASEGVLLANESYISRIEPHFELVKTIANNNYVFDGDLIHVKRKNISVEKLMGGRI